MTINTETALTLATGAQMTTVDINKYFETVFAAEDNGQAFPVNFDDVWPMAYSRKDAAKRALLGDFYAGEDFEVFHRNVENLGGSLGGRPEEGLRLSTQCLEFFIARKVRPIFEIYRQCRIEMRRQSEARLRAPSPAPVELPDIRGRMLLTLAEASAASGLGSTTLRKAVAASTLRAARVGGRWRVRPVDLVLYIEQMFMAQPQQKTMLALPEPSPLAEEIVAFVRLRHSWTGTASELARELGLDPVMPRGTASGLARHIVRMQGWLEGQGITVAHERSSTKRMLLLRCRV